LRKQKARERRNTLIAVGCLGLIVVLGLILFLRPGLIVPTPNSAYGSSLGRTLNGGAGECDRKASSGWLVCRVESDPGSGAGRTLLLRKGARGCWSAKRLRADHVNLKGCVGMRDLLLPKKPSSGQSDDY